MEPELWTNVAHLNAREGLECFSVTDWHYEGMDSMVFALNLHLSKHQSMSGKDPQVPRPTFGTRHSGSIDSKSIIFHIISSGSFQILHIRPMPKFRLSITPKDLMI